MLSPFLRSKVGMNRLRPNRIAHALPRYALRFGYGAQINKAQGPRDDQATCLLKQHRLFAQCLKQAGHADALSDEITQTRIGTSPLVSASIFAASINDGEPRPFFHLLMVVRSLPIFAAKSSSLISFRFR